MPTLSSREIFINKHNYLSWGAESLSRGCCGFSAVRGTPTSSVLHPSLSYCCLGSKIAGKLSGDRLLPMATCESHELLHEDLWVEILSWLPLRGLVKCRSVSKAWCRSLFPSAYSRRWRIGLLQLASFRAYWRTRYEYNGMSRLDEDDFHLGKFCDYAICDACNGYILFRLSHEFESSCFRDHYLVLNPITQNYFSLPSKSTCVGAPVFSMLAFDPRTSPYYKVLLMFDPYVSSLNKQYEVHVFSSETGAWTCSTVDPEIRHSMAHFGPTICFNGLAYQRGVPWISHTGGVRVFKEEIILFHVEGGQWELIQPPLVTLAPDERQGFGGLGQSAGTLHYAYQSDRRAFIRIWAIEDRCTSSHWILRHTVNLSPDSSPCNLSFHPRVVFHPFLEAFFLSSSCGSSYIYRLNDKELDLFCYLKGATMDEPYVIPILYCLNDPNSNRKPLEN